MSFDDLDISVLRGRRGEKWSTFPADVLPAWVADMDFPVCEPVHRLLSERVALSDFGYPSEAAQQSLIERFAQRVEQRFAWRVEPRRIELLTDVVQGLYQGLLALSRPGEGAIVQTPVYPPFLSAVAECDRRLVVNQLCREADGYAIDFDDLRAAAGTGTRILLFCNPQNPTGRAFSRAELEALAEIVLERDLIVLSDEIHADLVYPGRRHVPFTTLSPEIAARTVTLMSASKAFNIAGLRCAVAVFGSDDLKSRFDRLPPHLRGGLGSLGLAATELVWREGQPWLDEVLAYLEANRDFTARFVAERLPGLRHSSPEATFLAWLDCRELRLEPDPFRFFLDRARVALSDGAAFGPGGEGFVRLNFATSRAILTQVLERMHGAATGDAAQSAETR